MNDREIVAFMRTIREEQGRTLADVANAGDINLTTIWQIEQRNAGTLENVVKILKGLGYTLTVTRK